VHGTQEFENLKRKLQEYNIEIDRINVRLGKLSSDIEILKKNLQAGEKKMNQLMNMQKDYQKQVLYFKYAEAALKNMQNGYTKKEKEYKQKLGEYTQRFFDEMYTGTRKLRINDKYKIEVETDIRGRRAVTDTSPGLETVKNFAFIAALVQLAKEKAAEKSCEGVCEPYPLVLDAPFSQADEKHIPKISKLISEVAEQIILVIMEKDWNYAAPSLEGKVGKRYVIKKESEVISYLSEEK
jgi:DNA sulfur modification protein DndD